MTPPARAAQTHPEGQQRLRAVDGGAEFKVSSSEREGEVLEERYTILGFMDSGGTADVYLARDNQTQDLVVIKQLSRKMSGDPRVRERFLREANAAQTVTHPHVVRVLDVVEPATDAPFLVIEALAGETVGDYLQREGSFPIELVLTLTVQAAAALAASHAAGIVHRDVKPDNLFLVGRPGSPERLKLIDFGMAQVENMAASGDSVVLGTVQYMAPEQVLVEPVDPRTDIYGLGVVMFKMITGYLPFDSEPTADMLRHQLFSTPPPASWLADDLHPSLDALIRRAMSKHPGNRQPSMDQLKEQLEAIRAGTVLQVEEDPPCVPDLYEPRTAQGKAALKLLAKSFGRYASLPASLREDE